MPVGAAFCPGCGRSMTPLTPAERWAAVAGYFILLPAAVLLFLPAFRNSRFVRFHAWQSISLWGVFFLATATWILLSNIAAAVLLLLLGIVGLLGMFFLWIVLSLKAWQGERFQLPLFGSLAERLS
jgi:uncharacterized membrane protein